MTVPQEALKALVEDTKARMLETADYYGLPHDHIEGRHWLKMDRILAATTPEEAIFLQRRAIQAVLMTCLYCWHERRIRGPASPENFEKKAKSAESLAKWQEKQGNDEAAVKQKERAAALRREADAARVGRPPKQEKKLKEDPVVRNIKAAAEKFNRRHPKGKHPPHPKLRRNRED
jgi:hypothetical protein